jgi:S1-C subfamily serine protease
MTPWARTGAPRWSRRAGQRGRSRAGVERGDVIVQINGQRVDGPKAAARALDAVRPGDFVRMLVVRGPAKTFLAFKR